MNKERKLFYRFGELPTDEKSSIWNGEEMVGKEKGVSVYEAHKNVNGTYSPVVPNPISEKTLNDFIYYLKYYEGKRYIISGDLLSEVGTDSEPLLTNVEIIKEL